MGSLSAPGMLKILVIGAEGLDRVSDEQQPYYIIECGKQRSRSKPASAGSATAPLWNTAHKFELLDETAAVAVIKDEATKAVIGEGLIDLSRARLTGRDAAAAQLRNLAGQPAGLLRFKLKFQVGSAAAPAGEAGRASPHSSGLLMQQRSGGVDGGSFYGLGGEGGGRRPSDAGSLPRRISEAGSYRSTGSMGDGRTRSLTPTGQRSGSRGGYSSVSGRHDEPDAVLASATSKVSLAKQAMQQLTAELAELTGPGGQTTPTGQAGASPVLSSAGSQQQGSAFAAAAAQQQPWRSGGSGPQDQHPRSRQGSLNVLGQPAMGQQQQQHLQQQMSPPSSSHAWQDYRHAYHQTRQQHQQYQQQPRRHSGSLDPTESWNAGGPGGFELPGGGGSHQYQQQLERRLPRLSTGSLTPSGMSGMQTPPDMSPRAAAAYAAYVAAAQGGAGEGGGLPPNWPRLRGMFGGEVLSTEELVALYAASGPSSEKKLIQLLEEALAAAHAEKVATEQELNTVKQAMATMSKQHYMDAKRLKQLSAAAGVELPISDRPLTPSRFRNPDGTPPLSPRGGLLSMVDTKPPRSARQSMASDSGDLGAPDASALRPAGGLRIATGRRSGSSAAQLQQAGTASPTAAMTAAAAAAAATGELATLRAEHSKLRAASAQLESEVARLTQRAAQADSLEQQLQKLKEEQQAAAADSDAAAAGGSSGKHTAAVAAAGAAAGGGVAAAVAAAELEALRSEHARVRALAEGLEEEVGQLRGAQQRLQDAQQQLEDLQAQHTSTKDALAAAQAQLEALRAAAAARTSEGRSVSEWADAAEDFDSASSNGGSPMPAYKLQIQVHQLERQLAEAAARGREDEARRGKLAADMQELQAQLDEQAAAARRAEENARAAEEKAANQATIAAAARAEAAAALASTHSNSGKEAALAEDLVAARASLDTALADKADLQSALGRAERDSKEQAERLQAELARVQGELAAAREGGAGADEVAALRAQLAAAKEEAASARGPDGGGGPDGEEVEYLQAQLRRTLRQVVELQRQVQVLQQERSGDHPGSEQDHEAALDAAIRSEHEFLMQELVAAKLELAEVKEQQLITQRQLFKAQQQQGLATAASS